MPESLGPSKSNFHLAADPAFTRIRDEFEALVRNSIRLWPTPTVEEEIPIGASKLGGKPDLPPDFEWPQFHVTGTPRSALQLPKDRIISLPFMAQLNLEELARYDTDQVLPKAGMLYLFYFRIVYHEGKNSPDEIRVFHRQIDKEQLTRRNFPTNLAGDRLGAKGEIQAFTPCKLQFTSEQMLPKGEDCLVDDGLIMTTEEYDHWGDINYEFRLKYGEVHHMLGYPDLGSHGLRVPYELFPGDERNVEERVARIRDHRLLLQLADSVWGLMGFKMGRTIYFCMRNQDLARADFSRVWVDIE